MERDEEDARLRKMKKALVIAGDTLKMLQAKQSYIDKFIEIANQCDVVLACRVSPK